MKNDTKNNSNVTKTNEKDDGVHVIHDDSHKKHRAGLLKKVSWKFVAFVEKKNKTKRKMPGYVGIIAIVLICLFVFIIADVNAGGLLSEANGKFVSVFSRRSSEKFSVDMDGANVHAFQPYTNGFALLTENGVSYIHSSGNQSASQQIVYSSPDMSVAGKRTLVFDRGNTNYALLNSGSLYASQSLSENIIDAAVAKNGNYTIAVKGDNAKTVLYGFDSTGKILYQWNCPVGYIVDVAISRSGGKVAATVVDSENAVVSSKLYIFDFEYDSAYAEFDFTDEMVAGVKFLSNSKVQVVSEKKVYLVKNRELTAVYEYGSSDLAFTDIGYDTYTAVVTDDYSKDDSYILTAFGKNGQQLFSVPLSGKVRGVAASGKSISVLFSEKTETYSKRGKLVGTVDDIKHYNDIIINGNYIYLLTSDSVKRYPAYGNISSETVEDTTR